MRKRVAATETWVHVYDVRSAFSVDDDIDIDGSWVRYSFRDVASNAFEVGRRYRFCSIGFAATHSDLSANKDASVNTIEVTDDIYAVLGSFDHFLNED